MSLSAAERVATAGGRARRLIEPPRLIRIEPGRFFMGSRRNEGAPDERPRRRVAIERPFALGATPVTFAQYDRFVAATREARPGDAGWGRGDRPAIHVSWDDAKAYCDWLSSTVGGAFRLPSEAEWEYACRAGGSNAVVGGPAPAAPSNHGRTYEGGRTSPVGAFPPNAWGLYDMLGNVWEWCDDAYFDRYDGAPKDGRPWRVGPPTFISLRGGSWIDDRWSIRPEKRMRARRNLRNFTVGFRVAATLEH